MYNTHQGIVLVYDVTNRKSFDNLQKWIKYVQVREQPFVHPDKFELLSVEYIYGQLFANLKATNYSCSIIKINSIWVPSNILIFTRDLIIS